MTIRGINEPGGVFNVTTLPTSLALAGLVVAAVSYFFASERYRTSSVLAAYLISLAAVVSLIIQTGGESSPFLSLWLIASIFSGVFGMALLGALAGSIVGIFIFLALTNNLDAFIVFSLLLAGFLPLLMGFVLWHGKSSSEKTKERAYYDLANELNQVANKSEVVINAISDGVIAINNQGQIELINPAAERLVGWNHQDALNLDYKSVLQLLTKDGHEVEKSTDPVFEVLTTNQPKRTSDLQLQTSSGKKLVIEVVVSPIGRIGSGAIIVFRDVTKEQAEERAQAEFISTASHEMRTPVASIEGYLGLALNPATATVDAKARDFITKAHEAAGHLGRLFQDLLDVTKADDGRMANNPKVIDVVAFTNDVVDSLKAKANEKNLRLVFKPMPAEGSVNKKVEPIFYVDLDGDHLREILANLVENAIKYTPQGQVVVDVQGDDDHVVVSIQDSGIGIPSEDIPHLFQKFYRVDNTDTREIGGTGLGLYLCRRLVESMGGRIWVDSEYKKGSTFSIELPRISHEEANRLIEAGSRDSIKRAEIKMPLDENEETPSEAMSEQEKSLALSTPIIINKSAPTLQAPAQPAAATPVPPQQTHSDPLVGGATTPAGEQREPLRAQNGMVLPASWQAMTPNIQKAAQPAAPAPAPIAQPAQPVTPQTPAPAAQPQPVSQQGAQKT